MAQYTLIVFSNPTTPAQEDEYNEWYNNTHLDDMVSVPGFVTAQRFRLADSQVGEDNPCKYLALYELETDNLDAALADLKSRIGTVDMVMTDAFDIASFAGYVFAPITEKVHQAAILRPRRTA